VAKTPPPQLLAMLSRMGLTLDQWVQARAEFVGRLHRAGVRLISGVDSGINPAKRHGTLPRAVLDLQAAGLTIAQALATATSVAADALGLAGNGRVAVDPRAVTSTAPALLNTVRGWLWPLRITRRPSSSRGSAISGERARLAPTSMVSVWTQCWRRSGSRTSRSAPNSLPESDTLNGS